MSAIYRVWLNRGVRARDEIGLFVSEEVANHVASTYEVKEGQTTSVEPAELQEAGNVDQYVADAQLERIRTLLSPEEIELLRKRGNLL